MQYSLFKTRWGWFGLLANNQRLVRSCLPMADREAVRAYLLADIKDTPRLTKTLGDSQERIKAYFEGQRVDFADVRVDLRGLSVFEHCVLQTLRSIKYSDSISYADLAALSGRPRAVRAAANAVAKNPLPLIIPCHRVLLKDGSLGGFSAPGGTKTKKRLLDFEKR